MRAKTVNENLLKPKVGSIELVKKSKEKIIGQLDNYREEYFSIMGSLPEVREEHVINLLDNIEQLFLDLPSFLQDNQEIRIAFDKLFIFIIEN